MHGRGIRFVRPSVSDVDGVLIDIRRALVTGAMTNGGPLVTRFERDIERFTGSAYAVCVSSCTTGLQVLMKALGLTGEVIVPSYTFAATAQAVRWVGLEPVFCDIEPGCRTMDERRAEDLITSKTSAILGVHMFGEQCDVDRLASKVPHVIFDGAHAFGCTFGDVSSARFGEACVYSFHSTKHVRAFEGGVICTDDAILADRCRTIVNHGFDSLMFSADGTNAKMSEAHAACGIASLKEEAHTRGLNMRGLQQYEVNLSGPVRLVTFAGGPGNRRNCHYAQVVFDTMEQRELAETALHNEGVETRRYFTPLHTVMTGRRGPLPVTEDLTGREICLPNGHLTREERDVVSEIVLQAVRA